MKMKTFKERVLKQKEQTNIYMQKTKGPKMSYSSPNLDLRFKSKTLLNKQNQHPNKVQMHNAQNTFGAAKMLMRKSGDQFTLNLKSGNQQKVISKELLQSLRNSQQNFRLLSKSNNFQRCSTEQNLNIRNAFSKKHMKTQQCDDEYVCPTIEDCQCIKSQYENSEDSCEEEKLHYAKSYQRPLRTNNPKNILIHESLNYDEKKSRELVTFGPSEAKNIKKYQFSKEQEKRMREQIVNNIMMSTKAEAMRSCDFGTLGSLFCVNHTVKKAKYRLNADLTQEEEECFYCSKCAVNLARQGFDIEEISPLDRKMIMSKQSEFRLSAELQSLSCRRQEEFVSFEKRLQNIKNKTTAKLKIFNQKSEEMTKIDKKIDLTISNYDNLIDILKQMRQQEMNKVENFKKQKSLDINLKKNQLQTILDNIKDTFSEISNEKNKLMALKSKEFAFMFDSYIKRISSYEEYLTNLQQTQLAQDIAAFDANLESQELDQEVIIHQIFDEMYKKLTHPKLKALDPSLISQQISLKDNRIHNKMNEIQSGGSSMFYCEEQLEESRRPFRILFGNQEQTSMSSPNNLDESLNVNSSMENIKYQDVRYLKEENYLPTFKQNQ